MSVLFGRKTAGTQLKSINYARGLVISLYLVSWMFSFIATELAQTNNFNTVSCTMSIYTCIVLYALSKIVIYLFLMEKVYVVTAVGMTRKDFLLYRINMVLMTPYLGVVALMIIFRVAELDTDGRCYIGLLKPAALPLILYDMFLSCWLTLLFIRPLISSRSLLQGPSKGKLRYVARRTLVGAIVALILSSANIFTLVYFQGNERGLICLSSCTADVTLNAITIHWVTSRARSNQKMQRSPSNRAPGAADDNDGGMDEVAFVASELHKLKVPPYERTRLLSISEKRNETESHITVEAYIEEYHTDAQAR
ncbi:hypothetical protein BGZ99_000279 [Dissophora globulifera]|uniref:Uncharacterized protein n=1 Tax=Dissophora globulifera TaxID=979702 RepID=A0A9P6RUI3_9FUNG|nr:hypothetical protein BGZ99_000279 [Dissophora globulifera]